MKEKLQSPYGMKPQGVGPRIFRNAMPFLIIGILVGIFFPSLSHFFIVRKAALSTAGIIMLILGAGIYSMSMVQFIKGFPKGKLITNGVYRLSRNPLYSSWILLILPGLSFVCNNWLFLPASVSMYISFIIFIKEEEKQLLSAFGTEYTKYCNRVGRLVFIPKMQAAK